MFDDLIPGTDQYEVEEEVGHGTFSEVSARLLPHLETLWCAGGQ